MNNIIPSTPATTSEDATLAVADELYKQESIIERGLTGFAEAGAALIRIKKNKLYKEHYATYKEYCLQRWGFTPQHANQLIAASMTIDRMNSETTVSVLPASERQTRALSKSGDPAKVWVEAQEKTGKAQPTAKEIEEIITQSHDEIIDAEVVESTVEDERVSIYRAIQGSFAQTLLEPFTDKTKPRVRIDTSVNIRENIRKLSSSTGLSEKEIFSKSLKLFAMLWESFPEASSQITDKK